MTWQRGDAILAPSVIVVDPAGVATVPLPRPCAGFLAELREIASVQASRREAEVWLRLKRGELETLAEAHPEVREAFEAGQSEGLAQMRAMYDRVMAKAALPSGRRNRRLQREVRDLRAMKRAGLF